MTSEKHGIPALLSFFLCGLGQLTKNHFRKFLVFFLLFIGALYVCYIVLIEKKGKLDAIQNLILLVPLTIWFWNINDAYNSNFDLDSDKAEINKVLKEEETEN